MARFLIVPQWQGSHSSRAMSHIDGAEAIAGDLPRSACVEVTVPLEAGDELGIGVLRASALVRVHDAVVHALNELPETELPVIVGGDGGVTAPAVAHLGGDDLAVVWVSAHPALRSPDPQHPVPFADATVRALLGHVTEPLDIGAAAVPAERIVLVGARDMEDDEHAAIAEHGLTHFSPDDLTAERLASALAASGASRVYLHIDLDALDPSAVSGVTRPVPFGVEVDVLRELIAAVRATLPLAGATLAGFAPATPAAAVDDMGTILRIISALTR